MLKSRYDILDGMDGNGLKVATLNCFDFPFLLRRGRRMDMLAKELARVRADVICLQEVVSPKTVARFIGILEEYGYKTYFNKRYPFNQGGLLTAWRGVVSRTEFVRYRRQGELRSLQVFDRFLGKGYQKVEVETGGRKIVFFNTHLTCVYGNRPRQEKKVLRSQVRQLVGEIRRSGRECVVGGDLNIGCGSRLYWRLIRGADLVDPFFGEKVKTISSDNTNRFGVGAYKNMRRPDYILASRCFEIRKKELILDQLYPIKKGWINLSDHYGLLAEINWK